MKLIAVTGGIGSGKSAVLRAFSELGAYVIDCDEVSRRVMASGQSAYDEILDFFGKDILKGDGEIDRRRLAEIVFSDSEKLGVLNEITHKRIYEEIQNEIKSVSAELVCIEIPLLFSEPCPLDIDLKITVSAPENLRIKRIMKRDLCTEAEAKDRIKNQLSDSEMRRLADCVIVNSGERDEVYREVKKIYSERRFL